MVITYDLQFFAKDGPGGEKTEQPTAKKLDQAREDGQVCKSRELDSAAGLLVLFLMLKVFAGSMGTRFVDLFSNVYNQIPKTLNEAYLEPWDIVQYFVYVMGQAAIMVAPFFIAGIVVTVIITIAQVKWKITTKPLQPKLDKFNPINGFKRMFSANSLFELAKSVVKVTAIAYVAYSEIIKKQNELFVLYDVPLLNAIIEIGQVVIDVGLKISYVYIIIGAIDYLYQRHKFNEDMKMTKQEVKDEMKNTEGDPQIKGKQRQRMAEASRRRMMQAVPQADVVITNPTHYAVAIQYDAEKASAPLVVAKGADFMAQRIKEIAKDNQVEIVENKPLARMLYANVEVGQEIPPELYQTVAEILATVYRLKNKI